MMHEMKWKNPPPPISDDEISEVLSADVVIIGGGHAGTSAARAAAETGKVSVIVLEQQEEDDMRFYGGGEIGHINSKWQASRGIPPVDVADFVNDWQLRSNNRSNYRLIRKFAEKSGEAFDWLISPLTEEQKNAIYMKSQSGNENWKGSLNGIKTYGASCTFGPEWQKELMDMHTQLAKDNGAQFLYEMTALQLFKEGERVAGVIAENGDGDYVKVCANKAVILAAGDFTGNAEMCHDLLVEIVDFYDEGVEIIGDGQDGSGIRMGIWVGGKMEPRSVPAMGGYHASPGMGIIGTTGTLWVNKHGKRYCNEHFAMQHITHFAGCCQPNGKLWTVFDSTIEEDLTYQCPGHSCFDADKPSILIGGTNTGITFRDRLRMIMAGALEAGAEGHDVSMIHNCQKIKRVWGAQTLEELASYMFQDDSEAIDNFLNTVKRYNELCYKGVDDDFGKDPSLMHAIDEGPYFAYAFDKDSSKPQGIDSYFLRASVGGLLTDENQNVLGPEWEPIPGLYATGNCCGGRFGKQYHTPIPGVSLGMCHTLGREVGLTVAEL